MTLLRLVPPLEEPAPTPEKAAMDAALAHLEAVQAACRAETSRRVAHLIKEMKS